jgi:hypothetical protein
MRGSSLCRIAFRRQKVRANPALIVFFFFRLSEAGEVKGLWAVALFALAPLAVRGQEVTLPPMVVTGTFELLQTPSTIDLFTLHLQRQIEMKRALEETTARSPLFNAKFWSYLPPLQNCSSDSSLFFTPSYLSTDYRNAERALQESRKQSLFDGR